MHGYQILKSVKSYLQHILVWFAPGSFEQILVIDIK